MRLKPLTVPLNCRLLHPDWLRLISSNVSPESLG